MITVTALGLLAALAQAAPCESLRTLSLPNTTITSAQLVLPDRTWRRLRAGLPEVPSLLRLAAVATGRPRLAVEVTA